MSIHPILAGLIPSIAVGVLFWFVMRQVLRADRKEREALARADAQEAAAAPATNNAESKSEQPAAR